MALLTLGRQAVRTETIARGYQPPGPAEVAATRDAAGDDLDELAGRLADAEGRLEVARQDVLDRLTPWIPGDFLLVYGGLLTAWETMRGDFAWLLALAFGLAFAFVFGAAFASTGLKHPQDRPLLQLTVRAAVGGVVSLVAAAAIPNSGWYDFKGFRDNELPWVFTLSLLLGLFVFVLLGLQTLTGIKLRTD